MFAAGSIIVAVSMSARIRARLWVERGFHSVCVSTQLKDHIGDHVVGADADAVAEKLHGQMSIAEMPGDPHQLGRAMGVDFQERLRLCDDADDVAIRQS
jgi:hypothetical protein